MFFLFSYLFVVGIFLQGFFLSVRKHAHIKKELSVYAWLLIYVRTKQKHTQAIYSIHGIDLFMHGREDRRRKLETENIQFELLSFQTYAVIINRDVRVRTTYSYRHSCNTEENEELLLCLGKRINRGIAIYWIIVGSSSSQ